MQYKFQEKTVTYLKRMTKHIMRPFLNFYKTSNYISVCSLKQTV